MSAEGRRTALTVLAGCFLLSGAASLMDQVVWLRYLALVFGNTTWAAATLLAVFMAGLGGGALLCGRLADRLHKPLVVYAVAEIGVAVFALVSPALLGNIDTAYVAVYRSLGNQPALFAAGRALLAALFLGPPTLLMGGTLPLMLRGVTRSLERVGRSTAAFYGVNTLGAVLGTFVAGFVSIRLIGLHGTLALAAGANLLAALGAVAFAARLAEKVSAVPTVAIGPAPTPPRRWLLALFFAMGATSLAYEVLWTRILVFYFGSSVYAYSLMLLLVLIGLALGSLAAVPWADRARSPLAVLALLEVGIALWVPCQVWLFQRLNELLVGTARALHPHGFPGIAATQLLAALPLLAPATLLMGASFPFAVRCRVSGLAGFGVDVGRVYGFNTLGSVAGALTAGFVLIPWIGTQDALLLTGAVNGALAVWLLARTPGRRRWAALAALAPLLALAAMALLPPDRAILAAGLFRDDRPEDLVYFHEDAQASVTIRRLAAAGGSYLSLELNGVNVAGTSPDLYAIQKMQGHLPLLLAAHPRSVAHIGFGSGGTAWAVSRHPVDDILVVEISPEVLAASDRFFPHINHGVLHDPRVRVELNDGRNFLLATPERFDAVLSDSIHPRYAGNGSLYSLEYFRLLRRRLEPGGVASMWLPMYALTPRNFAMILEAFREVFPHLAVWYEASTLNAFTIVTGKVDGPVWDAARLERAFADPRVARELTALGIHSPADLLPMLLGTGRTLAPWLDHVPPHEDDLPAIEYESGAVLRTETTWLETFARLLALRPTEPPREYLEALPPGERARARDLYRRRAALLVAHRDALARGLARKLRGGVLPTPAQQPPSAPVAAPAAPAPVGSPAPGPSAPQSAP